MKFQNSLGAWSGLCIAVIDAVSGATEWESGRSLPPFYEAVESARYRLPSVVGLERGESQNAGKTFVALGGRIVEAVEASIPAVNAVLWIAAIVRIENGLSVQPKGSLLE